MLKFMWPKDLLICYISIYYFYFTTEKQTNSQSHDFPQVTEMICFIVRNLAEEYV